MDWQPVKGILADDACLFLPKSLVDTKNGVGIEKSHGWHVDVKPTSISTPAYTGEALRYRFIEYQYPMGSGFILREDWYVAPNIGLIRADAKDISKHYPSNSNQQLSFEKCLSTPMCLGADFFEEPGFNNQPDATMQLKSYYQISTFDQVKVAKSSTQSPGDSINTNPGENWLIFFPKNYTGWVDVRTSQDGINWQITEKWDWAENGIISRTVASNLPAGTYYAQYRPHIYKTPSKNEVQLNTQEMSWSNTIQNIVTR